MVRDTAPIDDAIDDGADAARSDSTSGQLRPFPIRAVGVAIVGVAAIVLVRLVGGVARARSAIADHESVHGPIEVVDGRLVDHQTAALAALCERVGAAAGFLYPFGVLVFAVPFVLFVGGALMIWRHVLPVRATATAFVLCVLLAIWAAPGSGQIITILE